jgi:hypothetical protein
MPATRPPDCDAVRRTHRPQSAKRTFRCFSNEELKFSLGAIPNFHVSLSFMAAPRAIPSGTRARAFN